MTVIPMTVIPMTVILMTVLGGVLARECSRKPFCTGNSLTTKIFTNHPACSTVNLQYPTASDNLPQYPRLTVS